MRFEAYADKDTLYRVKDQVRVSILNGDFSDKKFIVGKYAETAGEAKPYVFPNESVLMLDEGIFKTDST